MCKQNADLRCLENFHFEMLLKVNAVVSFENPNMCCTELLLNWCAIRAPLVLFFDILQPETLSFDVSALKTCIQLTQFEKSQVLKCTFIIFIFLAISCMKSIYGLRHSVATMNKFSHFCLRCEYAMKTNIWKYVMLVLILLEISWRRSIYGLQYSVAMMYRLVLFMWCEYAMKKYIWKYVMLVFIFFAIS